MHRLQFLQYPIHHRSLLSEFFPKADSPDLCNTARPSQQRLSYCLRLANYEDKKELKLTNHEMSNSLCSGRNYYSSLFVAPNGSKI